MHSTPRTVKTILLAAALIILLGTAYSAMTQLLATSTEVRTTPVRPVTLKEMIAVKAMQEYDRWHRGGTLRETDTAAVSILLDYWKLGVIPVSAKDLRNSSWQYRHPWSAVFISWVMQEAGTGDAFLYTNNHAKYIVWARDNMSAQDQPLFAAYDVKDPRAAWPEPGDLICMNRGRKQFTLQTLQPGYISHCDIVVETNREKGFIVAVGGNVGQTVNKRIVWLDANGYVDHSRNYQVLDAEENNPEGPQKEIFGIIRVDASRLASGNTPSTPGEVLNTPIQ